MSVENQAVSAPALKFMRGYFAVEAVLRVMLALGCLAAYPALAALAGWGGLLSGLLSLGIHRVRLNGLIVALGLNWACFYTALLGMFGWEAGFQQYASCLVFVLFLFEHLTLRRRLVKAVIPFLLMPVFVVWSTELEPLYALSSAALVTLNVGNAVLSTLINLSILLYFVSSLVRERRHLRELAENRQRLVSDLSHELKTPIAAMLTRTQVAQLEEEGGGTSDPELLRVLEQNLQGMRRLTHRMLDLSELETGAFRLQEETVDLEALLQTLLAEHRPLAEKKGLTLDSSGNAPLRWRTDPELIRMIVNNLLGNAVQYGLAGTTVTVSLGVATEPEHQGRPRMAIADEGPGLSEDQREEIFRPFFRGDSSRSRRGNSHGLGLSIAQKAAERLGGKITLESTSAAGSTFIVQL